MAELVDARDLKSRGRFSRAGSTPALGTINLTRGSLGGSQLSWLERLFDVQKVTGSTPVEPTATGYTSGFILKKILKATKQPIRKLKQADTENNQMTNFTNKVKAKTGI